MSRLDDAFAAIDAANGEDPNRVLDRGRERPAELVYGERMSAALARLYPEASDALRLAARAQHIRRWRVPRSDYPADRAGYHRWRNDLKTRHAVWAGEILTACGYSGGEIARIGTLIRKEHLKSNSDAQALEDVACLVFLEHYCAGFAAKHDAAKISEILRKTWAKMSEHGRQFALASDLPAEVRALIAHALA